MLAVVMRNVAFEQDAPVLHGFCRFEAQRLEGDGNVAEPALVEDTRVAFPDGVPGKIDILLPFEVGALLLKAGRIDEEKHTVPVVVKGIEKDADLVFVVDLLAPHNVIANGSHMIVEGEEDDVQ